MSIQAAAVLNQPLKTIFHCNPVNSNRTPLFTDDFQKRRSLLVMSVSAKTTAIPIMVNSCKGKMGTAFIKAAVAAGFQILPKSFGSENDAEEIWGHEIMTHGPSSDREGVLVSLFQEFPNMIVVDFTVPDAVNVNADLYCKVGVPFVMGTTGGYKGRLYKTVQDANNYAVISPQMAKQVIAFLALLEITHKQFPGAFVGHSLHVRESHQVDKKDESGIAKEIISVFKKLGASYKVEMIRDSEKQHAFHKYSLSLADERQYLIEFQHNVCGRSIYAENAVGAVRFLAKQIQSKAAKRIYNMVDVLREGYMK